MSCGGNGQREEGERSVEKGRKGEWRKERDKGREKRGERDTHTHSNLVWGILSRLYIYFVYL